MRVLTVGAGAIGGYFAKVLADGGHEVTVLARGETLAAIRSRGLTIIGGDEAGTAQVEAVAEVDPGLDPDLVILATKTYDTDAVVAKFAPAVTERTAVLPLQNGVNRAAVLKGLLPAATVFGGTVFMESKVTAPGEITYVGGPRRIVMGGRDEASRTRAQEIGTTLRESGVNAEVYDDVDTELWKKFVMVCAGNALTSLTRSTLGELLADDGGRRLVAQSMTESVTVGGKLGIGLGEDFVDTGVNYLIGMGKNARSSMLADIEAGRQTEVDALNGYVVDQAEQLGIDVPLHRMIAVALRLHNQRVTGRSA